MNKSELIDEISKKIELEKSKVESVLNVFVETIAQVLKKGDKVQLIGFGTFLSKHREARIGHNPKTGEEININESNVPIFKPGKILKDALND